MMTDELAGKVLDAYKTSPLLTGLLLLNLLILVGFGWYMKDRNAAVAEYVKMTNQELIDLHNQTIALAKECFIQRNTP